MWFVSLYSVLHALLGQQVVECCLCEAQFPRDKLSNHFETECPIDCELCGGKIKGSLI